MRAARGAHGSFRNLQLKVVGAGHTLELSVPDSATVGEIKAEIAAQTGLAPAYQKLLIRGKVFEDDKALAEDVGIVDRTKLMLMHSAAYAEDSAGAAAIASISQEIDQLAAANHEPKIAEEVATQLLCRLDAVDVGQSGTLREMRRAAMRRCEQFSG
jgi:hypothetical protein